MGIITKRHSKNKIMFRMSKPVFFKTVFFVYFVLFYTVTVSAYINLRHRSDRNCREKAAKEQEAVDTLNSQVENKCTLIFWLFLGILFILLFLGLIKGLLGLYCSPAVGIYGLHLLYDLPRPLNRYQEKELRDQYVIYDIGGWPIHPETKERTVRVLEKRTEFCLNLIFFLAYPLAAIVFLCALCFCIKNYQVSSKDDCFQGVNVISLAQSQPCVPENCPGDEILDDKNINETNT